MDLLLPKTFNLLVTISREKTDVKYRIENGRITNHCSCFAFSPLSPYRIGQGEPIITYLSKNNQLCEVQRKFLIGKYLFLEISYSPREIFVSKIFTCQFLINRYLVKVSTGSFEE